jgi:hypothetical protein
MPDKILYTDGREVTVTDTTLQVKNHEYRLDGVTGCGLTVLRPNRAPGIIVLLLGLLLIVAGIMALIPSDVIPDVQLGTKVFSANTLAIWGGAALALLGILILGLMRERYSVRIATAEGEKDAVVSDRQEYIAQIVDAINQAVTFVRTRTGSKYFTVRNANAS